jgi:dihydroneopterin aldolase
VFDPSNIRKEGYAQNTYFCFMGTIRQKVSLEGVRFFAYHGFYPEEQVLGTEFLIDIDVESEVYDTGGDDLSKTVNYERLYAIVSEEMKQPRKLIETVAHGILHKIRHEFLTISGIRIVIRKTHPPLGGEVRNSAIELTFKR